MTILSVASLSATAVHALSGFQGVSSAICPFRDEQEHWWVLGRRDGEVATSILASRVRRREETRRSEAWAAFTSAGL